MEHLSINITPSENVGVYAPYFCDINPGVMFICRLSDTLLLNAIKQVEVTWEYLNVYCITIGSLHFKRSSSGPTSGENKRKIFSLTQLTLCNGLHTRNGDSPRLQDSQLNIVI